MTEESNKHAQLKKAVLEILQTCGFKSDTEVTLNFSGSRDQVNALVAEASIDVAAIAEEQGKKFLLAFQCKEGELARLNKEVNLEQSTNEHVKANKATVISSDHKRIKSSNLKNLDEIKICYVFSEKVEKVRYEEQRKQLSGRGFHSWDSSALAYFKKTSATVGHWIKYEILKEFGLTFELEGTQFEQAVRVRQNNFEMYLFGAKPSTLIKIGYVSRRSSGRPQAYQRILSRDRIARISEFVTSHDAVLPNAIIIAFDGDKDVQRHVKFESGRLTFPRAYCSAWIIDGQHRVYGLLNTKFEKESEDQFILPVVAFKSLSDVLQNQTFVNINYHQKKIDPTLLCDLATSMPGLKNELTWPSLVVGELNKKNPLKGKIKILELEEAKPITISSFARYGLLEGLLGYDSKRQTYNGPLYAYAPFKQNASHKSKLNKYAMEKQTELLTRFFVGVAKNTNQINPGKDPWRNTGNYSLLKPTGINALLLLLSRILKEYPRADIDFSEFLKPIRTTKFDNKAVVKHGGGWKGFRNMANIMIKKLNKSHGIALRLYGQKEKR